MIRTLLTTALVLSLSSGAVAETATPSPLTLPDDRDWRVINDQGVAIAIVAGNPGADGPYSMFMRVPAGVRIPPHTHSDEFRHSLIISGTFHFAYGDTWNDYSLQPLGPGAFWTETPDQPHYGEVREGEVIAFLTAFGPTSTDPVKPAE